jgi:hypothetical protein
MLLPLHYPLHQVQSPKFFHRQVASNIPDLSIPVNLDQENVELMHPAQMGAQLNSSVE